MKLEYTDLPYPNQAYRFDEMFETAESTKPKASTENKYKKESDKNKEGK